MSTGTMIKSLREVSLLSQNSLAEKLCITRHESLKPSALASPVLGLQGKPTTPGLGPLLKSLNAIIQSLSLSLFSALCDIASF